MSDTLLVFLAASLLSYVPAYLVVSRFVFRAQKAAEVQQAAWTDASRREFADALAREAWMRVSETIDLAIAELHDAPDMSAGTTNLLSRRALARLDNAERLAAMFLDPRLAASFTAKSSAIRGHLPNGRSDVETLKSLLKQLNEDLGADRRQTSMSAA